MLKPAAVIAAAALGPHGLGWRGLRFGPGAAVIPPGRDAGDGRQRKLMSRAARLGAVVAREALAEAGLDAAARAEMGCFYGVGASGAGMDELGALVRASADDRGAFSLERCGRAGLGAATPLFAFQIMNNFTMCHAAILEGMAGPNAALFSRGAGTVHALREALWSLTEGDCHHALVGAADSALHPVTAAELTREGWSARGHIAGEGAAALVLAREADRPLAWITAAEVRPNQDDLRAADLVVAAPWGHPAMQHLDIIAQKMSAPIKSLAADALAASPALAWVTALDALVAGTATSALVLSNGIDGDLTATRLESPR